MKMLSFTCRTFFALLLLMSILAVASIARQAGQQPKGSPTPTGPGGKGGGGQNPPASSISNPDSVNDLLPASFSGELKPLSGDNAKELTSMVTSISNRANLIWPSTPQSADWLPYYVKDSLSKSPGAEACGTFDSKNFYVFHIVHWKPSTASAGHFIVVSSGWYVYNYSGTENLKPAKFTGTGDQLIYGRSTAIIVGISGFDALPNGTDLSSFKDSYSADVVPGTPANQQALGQLLSAVGGFASSSAAGFEGGGQITPVFITVGCQGGTAKLPFTITVTGNTVGATGEGQPPSATNGFTTCATNGKTTPCSSQRSFVAQDREYWDVSIAITTPGVQETRYTFSSGAIKPSITRHTDVYAMFDAFPLGYWLTKESGIPHVSVGVPITSQSLYRPYFGLSENLTGWTHFQKKLGLPVSINFFAGVVYMKTQFVAGNPTTQADFNSALMWKRVWKPMFGIEVPVSSMLSKIGGKSNSNSGKGGTTKSGSGS